MVEFNKSHGLKGNKI